MSSSSSPQSLPLRLLIVGLIFQGLSGLWGGGALVWDPTGVLLQMPMDLLAGSPFSNYRLPGLVLFLVLGVAPLIVAGGLWWRQGWAWYGAVAISGALIIWIVVEIWMVGYHPRPPLQLFYGLLGLFLLGLSLRSSTRRVMIEKRASRGGASE